MTSVRMKRRKYSIALALFAAGGCSFLLDADKQQCSKPEDCGSFNGRPIYTCENNFCENVSCESDAVCQERGSFICEEGACTPAICSKKEDCASEGEECTSGRCVDPVFSCFTQKQPLTSDEPAVFQLRLYSYGKEAVRDLQIKVCAIADLACNSPLRGLDWTYDDQQMLTIRGLENGSRYLLNMTGKNPFGSPLLEAEYFMQRPVVGLTQEADQMDMILPALVGVVAEAAGVTWDPTQGLVMAQTFGCDLKPLAGVSLSDSRSGSLYYLTGAGNVDATETNGTGVAGFINMEVVNNRAVQHNLTFSYGGRALFSFAVAPKPGVVTMLAMYMGDYGTTTDRSELPPR